MNEVPQLDLLASEAYRLFGRYRISSTLEACTCPVCMTEGTRQEIIATPVAALTLTHIQEYTNSAHGVPANQEDLKALLPRYLELIAADLCPSALDWEVALARFGEARKAESWPDAEAALLDRFLRVAVLRVATMPGDSAQAAWGGGLEKVLLMAAGGGLDLAGLLPALMDTKAGFAAVADMISDAMMALGKKGRLTSAFWEGHRDAEAALLADLTSSVVRDAACRFFEEAEDERTMQRAISILEARDALLRRGPGEGSEA